MDTRTIRRLSAATLTVAAALAVASPAAARPGNPGRQPGRQPAAHSQPMAHRHHGSGRSGVTGGALFGGDTNLAAVGKQLGRKLAIVRVYFRLGAKFTRYDYQQELGQGSTLLASLDTAPGSGPSYRSIAAGHQDREIRAFLEGLNHAAVAHHLPAIYISFEHEANLPAHRGLGTPSEFVRAWDHIHALAARARLNWQQGGRLHWVLILMREAYVPRSQQPGWARNEGQAAWYWPGKREADVIGVDGYNAGACRSVHVSNYRAPGRAIVSPDAMFGPTVRFARTHGDAPVFIAEWGTIAYRQPDVAPGYIHRMQLWVSATREVAAALYWDEDGTSGSCDYRLGPHPAAMKALAAMGHARGLQGHLARR